MNVFMGQVLTQPELPANSPRPPETPAEGIVVVDNDIDGMTRKYLYKAMGSDVSEILISESETSQVFVNRKEPKKAASISTPLKLQGPELGAVQRTVPVDILQDAKRKMAAAPISAPVTTQTIQVPEQRGPRIGEIISIPGASQNRPALQRQGPVPVDGGSLSEAKAIPMTSMPSASSFMESSVNVVEKRELTLGHVPQKQFGPGTPLGVYPMGEIRLGQAAPAAPPAPVADAAPPVEPGTCPGAVEMPDGRRIDPEDAIKLQDLCELMPFLLESYGQLQAKKAGNGQLAPGQSVPIAGQASMGPGGVPSTASQFGPAAGASGGGGGFVGSGGGGGGPGPIGPRGLTGIQGPAGPGSLTSGQLKTSGSFTSTGALVVIPDYMVEFTTTEAGNILIRASANFNRVLGSTFPEVTFGIQVNGTDYPLAFWREQQGAGADKVFDGHLMVELFLENQPAGHYEVRGIYSGGFPGAEMTFVAEPTMPAMLTAQHP